MKALLYKDLLVAKKRLRTILLLDLLFGAMGIFGENMGFFTVFPMLMWSAAVTSLISYDERAHFDRGCELLPVSRRMQVSEKYVIGLLYALPVFCLCFVGAALHTRAGSPERSLIVIAILAGGFVPVSLILPPCFLLGMEKGRIFYFVFYLVGLILSMRAADRASEAVPRPGAGGVALALGALLALYAVSWLLSVRFYEKREF